MSKKLNHKLVFSSLFVLAVVCFAMLGTIDRTSSAEGLSQEVELIEASEEKSITSDIKIVVSLVESVKHIFHTIQ